MKDPTKRQERLLQELEHCNEPITGTELALRCLVSRQVVVHDIALLRAAGIPIVSTPRGYFFSGSREGSQTSILSVKHPPALTKTELLTLVDYGIHIVNVIVEHSLYGELTGGLHLSSRRDVEVFLEQIQDKKVVLLSSLTNGQHMHTIEYTNETHLQEAIGLLREHGIVVYD